MQIISSNQPISWLIKNGQSITKKPQNKTNEPCYYYKQFQQQCTRPQWHNHRTLCRKQTWTLKKNVIERGDTHSTPYSEALQQGQKSSCLGISSSTMCSHTLILFLHIKLMFTHLQPTLVALQTWNRNVMTVSWSDVSERCCTGEVMLLDIGIASLCSTVCGVSTRDIHANHVPQVSL